MKKSKLVLITSSCRKNSNSVFAANYLIGLPQMKKYSCETFDINRLRIRPCCACNSCEKNHKCIHKDGAGMLIERVEKADAVIISSPVYFTGVPAKLKAFIDRNQVQWHKTKNKNQKSNRGAGQKQKIKTGVIILTAGQGKPEYFRPAESEIRSFFAVNNIKTRLVLRLGGMDDFGAAKEARKLAVIRKAAEKIMSKR